MKDIIDSAKFLTSILQKFTSRKFHDVDLEYAIKMTNTIASMLDSEREKLKNKKEESIVLRNWDGEDE